VAFKLLLPQPAGGVGLRVKINHEHTLARVGETGGETDDRRRLADAALLVGESE